MMQRLIKIAAFLFAFSPVAALADGWVALAIDGHGTYGYAYGKPSQGSAASTAMSYCNGRCHIDFVAQANCVAYADSNYNGYWYGTGYGPTRQVAVSYARGGCSQGAPGNTCSVREVACSQ